GAMLYLNGEIEETGLAGGVMGHPAHGIRWVCRRFAPHGIGLEPGQVILAGSFTRPVVVKPGDNILADYGPLGKIEVDFT
ncbi:MAG: 2-oxo-hepta-3-ene-1,7-dioic acid hydratase, partial [Gammaproteobacteria bacterium]|nr:2-oxo-hepta-3-ene-1,7-dioic acid hydratase [Gammaproteobacteria bacterium]